jgi:hypothetical protein
MSEAVFQSAFVRLVADEEFLRQMQGTAPAQPDLPGLSESEASGLRTLARSPGLKVMRKLHLGFRLNKLLSMLPLTCKLLGRKKLAAEAGQFWRVRPSASFYFLDEAEAFAEYLDQRQDEGLRVAYLGDVLAYETALLILQRPRLPGVEAPVVRVAFRHDPHLLLSMVREGLRPHAIPRFRTKLLGSADEKGEVHWTAAKD